MSSVYNLLLTCRALVLRSSGKLIIENVPTPEVTPGSVIVKVLVNTVVPGQRNIIARKVPGLYTPDPIIPGGHAIGRVAAVGPDTTTLQAGETVIIAPATGSFSGAAVDVAVAMDARIIAIGHNMEILKNLQSIYPSIKIVPIKSNFEEDLAALKAFGPIDAFLDISPHVANDSSHIRSCFMALKPYRRASLMRVITKDIAIPYMVATLNNITIRGQYMYEREDARGIIKLVESGALKLGKAAGHDIVRTFKYEDWEKAVETSSNSPGAGKIVVFEH
ncbi:hypothetical protein B7463_g9991, partial [Scytalidium lignicola]